jgi:hypothetical protein
MLFLSGQGNRKIQEGLSGKTDPAGIKRILFS